MANNKTLTAANAVLTIQIAGLFPAVQLQGFSADDVTDISDLAVAEAVMGVDGVLSAGFVFVPVIQGITLQADSDSCAIFDQWNGQQQATRDVFRAQGVLILPSIGSKWSLNRGVLTGFKPVPDTRKILQPRKFAITWESMQIAPV